MPVRGSRAALGLWEEPKERLWLCLLPCPALLSSTARNGDMSPHPKERAASSSLPACPFLPPSVIQETAMFPLSSSVIFFTFSFFSTLFPFPTQFVLQAYVTKAFAMRPRGVFLREESSSLDNVFL